MKRTLLVLAAVGAVLLGAVNAVAYRQVRAMTTFVPAGERTPPPEELGWLGKIRVLLLGVSLPRPTLTAQPTGPHQTVSVLIDDGHIEAWVITPPEPRGTVALFHGYGGTRSTLLPLSEHYVAHGWRTLVVDFRGSGGSSGNDTTLSVREALDVAAVSKWMDQYEGPKVLHGFSMGGAAVLRAVARHDVKADKLVVESTFDDLSTTVGHRFEALGLPAQPGTALLLGWGSVLLGESAFDVAPAHDASKIDTPILVISGLDDARVHPEEAQHIGAAPSATLALLEGHGHGLAVHHPQFSETLQAFLTDQ